MPGRALAHEGRPLAPHDLWSAWSFDPAVIIGLLLSVVPYAIGSRRLRARSRHGRALPGWRVAAFYAGIAATAIALVSPLAELGGVLFSAHMVQHVVLMLVAAPLLLLGAPSRVMLWALPQEWRRTIGDVMHAPAIARPWRILTNPLAAWLLHAVAIWVWHVPAFFEVTLRSEAAHIAQHVSFFGSALLFWWVLGERGHTRRLPAGAGVLYVFTTAVHGAALGAYLTIASSTLYPGYSATTGPWGLTPLEDQQLAGLIMWVPSGVIYVVIAVALLAAWMAASEREVKRVERARGSARRVPLAGARGTLQVLCCLTLPAVLLSACDRDPVDTSALMGGADPARGPALMRDYGCIGCHVIPGVAGAHGRVGPPLEHVGARRVIAGRLPNTPDALVRWIVDPRSIDSLTIMPATGISVAQARDVAAYLYQQR